MNGKAFFGHLVAVVAEDLNLNYEFIAPKSFVMAFLGDDYDQSTLLI